MTNCDNNRKHKNLIIQQDKELFWAKIFIYYINQRGGFDYKAEPHSTSTIDVRSISQSKKYQALNMQLTWVKELELNPNKPATKYLFFNQYNIKEAIERKTNKYIKRGEKINDIILLLQGYMAKPWANDVLTNQLCDQFKDSPFRGIYYIVRPKVDSSGKEHPKNGSVLPIKPLEWVKKVEELTEK